MYDYHICEFYYLGLDDLIFSDKVRYICEDECPHHGKSWACPPAIDSIKRRTKECQAFEHSLCLYVPAMQ
ncbi:MAG: hypothetical protein CVU91_13335 [Firmicutes bacterium HGW-Firmicutes-16]|nr:MAG: hypothetical protein CVU91_13335 [Firmicutes bacterium HGW-Firmicutes-16]